MTLGTPVRTEAVPSFTGRVVLVADSEFTGSNTKTMQDILGFLRPGDTVVFAGDILTLPPGSSNPSTAKKSWETVIPFFEKLKERGIRPLVIFGNHDGPVETASQVLSPVLGQFYSSGKVSKSFVFTNGDSAFICLSGRSQTDLDSDFLKKTLTRLEAAGFKKITIVSHYPIDAIGKISPTGERISSYLMQSTILGGILADFSSRLDITVAGGHQHVGFLGDYLSSNGAIRVHDLHIPSPKLGYRYPDGSRSQRGYAVFDRGQFSLLSITGESLRTPVTISGLNGSFSSTEVVAKGLKLMPLN